VQNKLFVHFCTNCFYLIELSRCSTEFSWDYAFEKANNKNNKLCDLPKLEEFMHRMLYIFYLFYLFWINEYNLIYLQASLIDWLIGLCRMRFLEYQLSNHKVRILWKSPPRIGLEKCSITRKEYKKEFIAVKRIVKKAKALLRSCSLFTRGSIKI